MTSDPQIATRDWQFVMDQLVKLKKDQTQDRWQTGIKDKAFDSLRHLPLLETRPKHFLRVLEAGKVSTYVYLRRMHNFRGLLRLGFRARKDFHGTEIYS